MELFVHNTTRYASYVHLRLDSILQLCQLQGRGGCCPGQFILPPPPHLHKNVKYWMLFLLFQTIWIVRCINYNHSSNQILQFSVLYGLIRVGCKGGWQAVQGNLSCPHLHHQSWNLDAHSTFFKLSECEDWLNMIINQFKFGCFLDCTDSYA